MYMSGGERLVLLMGDCGVGVFVQVLWSGDSSFFIYLGYIVQFWIMWEL